jgi:hypothetical protein
MENALIPHRHDLTMRPVTGSDELGLFNSLPYVLNDEVAGDLAAGRRHPEWLWLALRDDCVVARAGWWSRPGDQHPLLMDIFDIDGRIDDGVRLLQAALPAVVPAGATPPQYSRFLPADWRDHRHTRQAVGDRMGALERVGAKLFVERLRLEWRPGTPVAELSGRLAFRPVRSPGELIELMTLVLDGTLDAHSRDDLTRMTAREAAQEQYRTELERYSSPREWWQIATLPDGEPRAPDRHDLAMIRPGRVAKNPWWPSPCSQRSRPVSALAGLCRRTFSPRPPDRVAAQARTWAGVWPPGVRGEGPLSGTAVSSGPATARSRPLPGSPARPAAAT